MQHVGELRDMRQCFRSNFMLRRWLQLLRFDLHNAGVLQRVCERDEAACLLMPNDERANDAAVVRTCWNVGV